MNRGLWASSEAGGAGPGCLRWLGWSRWDAWLVGLSRPSRLVPSKNSAGAELADHGGPGTAGAPGTGLGAASWLQSPLVSSSVSPFLASSKQKAMCSRYRSRKNRDA